MKPYSIILIIIFLLTCLWCYAGYLGGAWIPIGKPAKKGQIRIACVGDSITYGAMIKNWFRYNYPHVLAKKSGSRFCVHNYGFSGRTAMATGDHPYVKTYRYKRSLLFNPDIVVLKFGTNDTKTINWKGPDAFKHDYEILVNSYINLPSRPIVYLLSPAAPHYINGKTQGSMSFDIRKPQIIEEIAIIKDIAHKYHLPFIDIYSITENHPKWFVKDGIHPNAAGAAIIATAVYQEVNKLQDPPLSPCQP